MERPRAVPAKLSNQISEPLSVKSKPHQFPSRGAKDKNEYERRHDRYEGYDPKIHQEKLEEMMIEERLRKDIGLEEKNEDLLEKEVMPDSNAFSDTRTRIAHSIRNREVVPDYIKASQAKESKIVQDFVAQEEFLASQKDPNLPLTATLPSVAEMLYRKNLEDKERLKNRTQEVLEQYYGKQGVQEPVPSEIAPIPEDFEEIVEEERDANDQTSPNLVQNEQENPEKAAGVQDAEKKDRKVEPEVLDYSKVETRILCEEQSGDEPQFEDETKREERVKKSEELRRIIRERTFNIEKEEEEAKRKQKIKKMRHIKGID